MEKFNIEEMNLMCIYNTGSRTGLMKSLKDMRQYLGSDERELLGLTDQVLEKLDIICGLTIVKNEKKGNRTD